MRAMLIAALAAFAVASAARAEVVDAQSNGFEVRQALHIAAPPARVYAALAQIGHWWNGAHSFSGDAAHLSLDPTVGGCLCEVWPGGSAMHLRVVLAEPPKTMRLEGALGPLQALGVTGHLTWKLTPAGDGADLVQTYDVGGHATGGLNGLAAPVDRVLGEQAARLKRWVETGSP